MSFPDATDKMIFLFFLKIPCHTDFLLFMFDKACLSVFTTEDWEIFASLKFCENMPIWLFHEFINSQNSVSEVVCRVYQKISKFFEFATYSIRKY